MLNCRFLFLLFVFSLAGLTACNHAGNEKGQKTDDTVVADKAIISHDTLELQGRWMVFFMPTRADYDRVQRDGEADNALYAIAIDFDTYMRRMLDTLHKTGWIKTQVTTQRFITVKMNNGKKITFDRLKGNSLVGSVLTDGRQLPQFDYGVLTDVDYWRELHRFFRR